MPMNTASARNLPDSSCARRGWRTSRLRSVPWLYSVATAPANRHSATIPTRFETSTTPWTKPVRLRQLRDRYTEAVATGAGGQCLCRSLDREHRREHGEE